VSPVHDFSRAAVPLNHGISALPCLEVNAGAASKRECKRDKKCEFENLGAPVLTTPPARYKQNPLHETRAKIRGCFLTLRSDFSIYRRLLSLFFIGKTAGEGNRSLVCSLGSCHFAMELNCRRHRVARIWRDLCRSGFPTELPGRSVAAYRCKPFLRSGHRSAGKASAPRCGTNAPAFLL
jgi:hypothetical protein